MANISITFFEKESSTYMKYIDFFVVAISSFVKSLYTFETTPCFLSPVPQLFKNWDKILCENLSLWGQGHASVNKRACGTSWRTWIWLSRARWKTGCGSCKSSWRGGDRGVPGACWLVILSESGSLADSVWTNRDGHRGTHPTLLLVPFICMPNTILTNCLKVYNCVPSSNSHCFATISCLFLSI